MEDGENIEKALLSRVRGIDPHNAQEVVSHIMLSHSIQRIKDYMAGLHGDMKSLIDITKRPMKLKSTADTTGPVQNLAPVRTEKQLQASSKPMIRFSNAMQYLPSQPEPRNIPCSYIFMQWLSSSGFGPLGRLEMEIRHLLIMARPFPVLLVDLPSTYSLQYNKLLQIRGYFRTVQWDAMIQLDGMTC